eukprot:1158811-Pelagomonas_calceolata.AAC.4
MTAYLPLFSRHLVFLATKEGETCQAAEKSFGWTVRSCSKSACAVLKCMRLHQSSNRGHGLGRCLQFLFLGIAIKQAAIASTATDVPHHSTDAA